MRPHVMEGAVSGKSVVLAAMVQRTSVASSFINAAKARTNLPRGRIHVSEMSSQEEG